MLSKTFMNGNAKKDSHGVRDKERDFRRSKDRSPFDRSANSSVEKNATPSPQPHRNCVTLKLKDKDTSGPVTSSLTQNTICSVPSKLLQDRVKVNDKADDKKLNTSGVSTTPQKSSAKVDAKLQSLGVDKSPNRQNQKGQSHPKTSTGCSSINKVQTSENTPKTSSEMSPLCVQDKVDTSTDAHKRDKKNTKYLMRKQKRAKRHKSDGYMLGLELAANSSEDEAGFNDSSLGDAINFLQLIRNPSLQNLAKLRRSIKTNDKDWMKEFLEFDGLGLLFQCLKDLSAIQGFHLTDMVLKMECVMCIREVVNSQSGLDCLLRLKERNDNLFGRRFASGMYKDFDQEYTFCRFDFYNLTNIRLV